MYLQRWGFYRFTYFVLCYIAHIVRKNTLISGLSLVPRQSRGVRIWSQAEQIWGILTGFVMLSERQPNQVLKITYAHVAKLMGAETAHAGHVLARPLELIGRLCLLSHVPPLNIIVVSGETGAPGAEVLVRAGSSVELDQIAVADHDWFAWRAPSANLFRMIWEARGEKNRRYETEDRR
jgi:hypothetical protein